jgi:hypothetical protein
MKLPVVPVFPAADTSISNLQALADCVRFLTVSQFHPEWHCYCTATFPLTVANTWYSVDFTDANVALDSDQVLSSPAPGAMIRTPGYYSLTGCVPFQTQSGTSFNVLAGFQFTAGPYNAAYSAGTTKNFGIRQGYTAPTVSWDETVCCEDISPYCYAGDSLALICLATVSATVDNNSDSGVTGGRFVCNFTGKLIRLGP